MNQIPFGYSDSDSEEQVMMNISRTWNKKPGTTFKSNGNTDITPNQMREVVLGRNSCVGKICYFVICCTVGRLFKWYYHIYTRLNRVVDCGEQHKHIYQRAMILLEHIKVTKGSPRVLW